MLRRWRPSTALSKFAGRPQALPTAGHGADEAEHAELAAIEAELLPIRELERVAIAVDRTSMRARKRAYRAILARFLARASRRTSWP